MKNKDITERAESMDRKPVDGVQKSQDIFTKPLAECVHSPMGKGVTKIVEAVTVNAEPGNTLMLGHESNPVLCASSRPTQNLLLSPILLVFLRQNKNSSLG